MFARSSSSSRPPARRSRLSLRPLAPSRGHWRRYDSQCTRQHLGTFAKSRSLGFLQYASQVTSTNAVTCLRRSVLFCLFCVDARRVRLWIRRSLTLSWTARGNWRTTTLAFKISWFATRVAEVPGFAVEPYNFVMCVPSLLELTNLIVVRQCFVLAACWLRPSVYDGALYVDVTEFQTNIVPFQRTHFMLSPAWSLPP